MSCNVIPRETTKKVIQRDAFKTQRSQKAILKKKEKNVQVTPRKAEKRKQENEKHRTWKIKK